MQKKYLLRNEKCYVPRSGLCGAGGLFLTLMELQKFGIFYLQEGKWNGRQQVDAPYGHLFWRGEHNSYRADGKYCQYTIVLPDKNAVGSLVSE